MSSITMSEMTSRPFVQDFEDLFLQHYELVYRTACVVTGSPEDAEDVLQTIFLRLLRREVLPDLQENPKGYFYRAAVNVSLTTIRSRRRQIEMAERFEAPVPSDTGIDETLHKRLVEAIATLSAHTVEILVLRYVHDYTDAEIATLLGRSRGTIAVTLFRARVRLRKLMRALSGEKV